MTKKEMFEKLIENWNSEKAQEWLNWNIDFLI